VDNLRAKSAIVSGEYLKYSRFWRPRSETGFDLHCVVGLIVASGILARKTCCSRARESGTSLASAVSVTSRGKLETLPAQSRKLKRKDGHPAIPPVSCSLGGGLIPSPASHVVLMAQWRATREPPKTKAELREMLAEAVRNPRRCGN
jgi:hypothetical protein